MAWIKWAIALFKAESLVRWGLAAFIGMAGLWGYGALKHHQGYAAGEAAITAKVQEAAAKETERQRLINERALNESRQIVEQLTNEKLKLEQIIQENADAADSDPDRDHCGIGADGVRRLNKVHR